MNTISSIKSSLQTLLNVPVYDDGGSITYPSATFDIIQDVAALHGDGKACARVKSAKIDLWYLSAADRDSAQATVTELLDGTEGCTSPDIVSTYDTIARKHRATFTFEIV